MLRICNTYCFSTTNVVTRTRYFYMHIADLFLYNSVQKAYAYHMGHEIFTAMNNYTVRSWVMSSSTLLCSSARVHVDITHKTKN
jgi:hypothetical protein